MFKIILYLLVCIFIVPASSAETYIATRQELWFNDSSYTKTSHHIKVGKSFTMEDYKFFGELGVGEDISEGTPIGSGLSYDYLRFGVTKKFFNSLRLNVNYRSKMKSIGKDLNWIVINTKYTF